LTLASQVVVLKTAPGHEGHVWLVAGNFANTNLWGNNPVPNQPVTGVWHSIDAGETFRKLPAWSRAEQIGFGKAAPGSTYPAIFIGGILHNKRGIYRSDDKGNTWERINDDRHQYGSISCMCGDMRVYGRIYFGTNGMGIIYGEKR
jgi:hypothetical protein